MTRKRSYSIFDEIFLPVPIRNGVPIPERDREETEFRPLTPIMVARETENQAQRSREQTREMLPAPGPAQRRSSRPPPFRRPRIHINEAGPPPNNRGNPTSTFPTPESTVPILRWFEPGSSQSERSRWEMVCFVSANLNQVQGLRDTVQTVRSDDPRFRVEGYQSLRRVNEEGEKEEAEMVEEELEEGEVKEREVGGRGGQ